MAEILELSRIGKEDLHTGSDPFEARLGDGRRVILNPIDSGYWYNDTATRTTLRGTDPVGRLRRLTDAQKGLWEHLGSGHYVPTSGYRVNAARYGMRISASAASNRQALQDTADAVADLGGGTVELPPGEFLVTPDASTGKIVELASGGITFEGAGKYRTSLKLADNSPSFSGFFVPSVDTLDLSGSGLRHLTLDANYDGNAFSSETELTQTINSFTSRRNGFYGRVGNGFNFEHLRLIDFPRQALFINANMEGTYDAYNIRMMYNDIVVNTRKRGDDDFDLTALFARGQGIQIMFNNFTGGATNYYLCRTAIQASGEQTIVACNNIKGWYRGVLVGNGSNYDGVADGVVVSGNTIRNCSYGIVLLSNITTSVTSGAALSNAQIVGNSIYTDAANYHRSVTDSAVPNAILADSTNELPMSQVLIAVNSIDNVLYTDGGNSGIHINLSNVTGTTTELAIIGNRIRNSPEAGISVLAGACEGLTITDNIMKNVGRLTGASAGQLAGIRVTNVHTGMSIDRNKVVDTRGTTITTACVHLTLSSGSANNQALDNEVYLADSRDIPVVETTTSNGAPLIRARTGPMDFVKPTSHAAYGSTIIDQANGIEYYQDIAPSSGATWNVRKGTGTCTITGTGFSSNPTGTARWQRNGDDILLFVPELTGTSNAATFTLTGLDTLAQSNRSQFHLVRIVDNGTEAVGVAEIDGATITLRPSIGGAANAWTASGTKTFSEQCLKFTAA